MALRPFDVTAAPADVAAALDAGTWVLENLGSRPLRFVAGAAGESAPEDPRDGHLLHPGAREAIAIAAGAPLWAWSDFPTRAGLTPSWMVAGLPGAGGGGGLTLLHGSSEVSTTLDGQHAQGATVLTMTAAAGLRTGRILVGDETHEATAVDESANTVTIAAPGLMAQQPDDTDVVQVPLRGADDVLTLPDPGAGRRYVEFDVRFLFDLPRLAGGTSRGHGHSSGAYYAPASSWYESLNGNSYWWAGVNADPSYATFAVGVANRSAATSDLWTLEFNPTTSALQFVQADPNRAPTALPRAYELVAAGRVGAA